MSKATERAASRIMVRVDAKQWQSQAYRDAAYKLVEQGIGGIGVFIGALETTAVMIDELQRRAGGKLFVAADYEYGLPMRLEGGISYPRAMALGMCSPETTHSIASLIAIETAAIGVNWNWAPVADINSNRLNPIINTRSFGESPEQVALHVQAYVRGLQEHNVLACAKHFPGHGDTHVDSHVDLPTIDIEEQLARQRELMPFQEAIEADVASIMVGHIVVPFLDTSYPASLSKAVVGGLLRGKMGYNGLVITDALDMHAIADRYPSGEAAVLAIEAGADIALMPCDVHEAVGALTQAIETGRISPQMLDKADERLDAARKKAGIRKPGEMRDRSSVVIDQATHALFALRAADEAIRVLGNERALPISQYKHIAALAAVSEADMDSATTWFQSLTQAVEMNIDCGFIDGTITESELTDLSLGLAEADVIVLALFGRAVAYRGNLPGAENLPQVVSALAGSRPVIVVACGSPYGIEMLPAAATIYTYSDTLPSIAASVMKLIGRFVR
jgi:beta-glucosidase-like glycosyl hydrolase